MAPHSANVNSIEIVRAFRTALMQFIESAHMALTALEIESRRAIDWIENDRTRYWPREEKRALDTIGEARVALARCELTASEGQNRSCYDERKALEKAKKRLELTGDKIRRVKLWRQTLKKEVDEFLVQSSKLKNYLDNDLLQAIAALERMSGALDRYVQQHPAVAPANDGLPSVSTMNDDESGERNQQVAE